MFDRFIYPVMAPWCEALARPLAARGITADQITLSSFMIGLAAFPLLCFGQHRLALVAILINRLLDGVDGALARLTAASDRGAFLDITLDFLIYALVPLGFAIFDPQANALPASCLLASFIGTGITFLTFSLIAERRGLKTPHFRNKGIVYLAGLAEGVETIVFFVLICLWPSYFALLAYIFSVLCLLTAITRLIAGWRFFSDRI